MDIRMRGDMMQTLIVVKMNGIVPKDIRERIRNRIKKEMQEGLLIIDDTIQDLTLNNITGELGLEFNEEVNYEKESI